ncbi:MAG: hypothetical protein K9J37_03995 [Saprospiraceae bacterium]|nr:hypothetical protein [Saprospiraceae bacterium]MCF8249047.1 hypothetical protein [Saprospiraceae bacterium]MCF8282718.1 hypothetical protein [Bacteroidales bacterium]MCF8311069.1 hypothetical protein [Saprospiraceae bacterium]MCF8443086.1 hypothetical protein [Saprospiraceae bacterium]
MKLLFSTSLILCFCTATWSQITPNQLLATAWDDPALQLHREQQAYLENTDFSLPLLRKLEIRTETRDLDPEQQEYALRIGTNGFGMKRTQTAIYGSMKELSEAERQLLVQEALLDRYELLLDVHFDKKNTTLLERQKQVLLDKKNVFGQQLSLGLTQNLDDYFRAEEDLLEVDKKLFNLSGKAPAQRIFVQIFTGKEWGLAVDSLMPIPMMKSMAALGSSAASPAVRREQAQANMAALEAEMKRMEGKNLLSYLQFRYSGNAKDLLEDRFAVGAGFELPWPKGTKLAEQERQLKALDAKMDAEMEKAKTEQAFLQKMEAFTKLISEHAFLQNQYESFKNQYDPQRLYGSGLENPETLLRVQETLVRLDMEMLSVEKDVYQAYLSLLSETGLLSAEPARNFLSPSWDLIPR